VKNAVLSCFLKLVISGTNDILVPTSCKVYLIPKNQIFSMECEKNEKGLDC